MLANARVHEVVTVIVSNPLIGSKLRQREFRSSFSLKGETCSGGGRTTFMWKGKKKKGNGQCLKPYGKEIQA